MPASCPGGETNVFNLTYVVPKNSSSLLMNTATATTMVNESKIYAEASWAVNILHPRLLVNKTVTPEKVCQTGGNVTYKIVVTNVGDAALSNITLVDSFFGAAPAKLIPQNLLPGQSVVWSFNATLKKGATSIATATGVDALGRTVSASCKVLTCFETDDQGDCHHENCSYECKED